MSVTPEALLAAHAQEIGGIALVVLQSQPEADGVVTRVVASACRTSNLPTDPRLRRRWLLGATAREIRRRRSQPAHVDPILPPVPGQAQGAGPAPFAGQGIDRFALLAALGELPLRARTLLALQHVGELPVDELAAVMDVSESAMRGELTAGRERLRRGLESATRDWLQTEEIDAP